MKMLNADLMLIAKQMALKPIVFVMKAGHTIQVISQLVAWI